MLNFKIYVVSLSSEINRRQSIKNKLDFLMLNFEFVDAVDFRFEKSADVINEISEYEFNSPRDMTSAEIGCALSHRNVYKKIIADNIDYGVVLEDDAVLNGDFADFIKPSNLNRIDFDIIVLGYSKLSKQDQRLFYIKEPIKTKFKLLRYSLGYAWSEWTCGTVGYVIKRDAASRFLSKKYLSLADDWYQHKINCSLNILHCRPSLVVEDFLAMESSIEASRVRYLKKTSSYLDVLRVLRGFFRKAVFLFFDARK
ncbi:MAG: glycosyltransferase family 25 protein [Plesiomonas sp.]